MSWVPSIAVDTCGVPLLVGAGEQTPVAAVDQVIRPKKRGRLSKKIELMEPRKDVETIFKKVYMCASM